MCGHIVSANHLQDYTESSLVVNLILLSVSLILVSIQLQLYGPYKWVGPLVLED